MLKISKENAAGILDKDIVPAAHCLSGDTVEFETRDCYDDSITSEERPLGDREDTIENPATGPLYIEDARAGDVLKVEILDIVLRDWGVMRTSVTCGAFVGDYKEKTARIFTLENDETRFDDKLTLKLDPMIGVIGTAPSGDGITTDTPDYHGGNMDCRKIGRGSVLYLPVCVDGALLSMGDVHALMGDGESLICGLETGALITVRVTVLKDTYIPTPFLLKDETVMTIRSARTLDEAGIMAAKDMKAFVRYAAGKDDFEAGMFMSLVSDMVVCQVVNPLKTVRMEFPYPILEEYGYTLP